MMIFLRTKKNRYVILSYNLNTSENRTKENQVPVLHQETIPEAVTNNTPAQILKVYTFLPIKGKLKDKSCCHS
jgi:hypothetical protein